MPSKASARSKQKAPFVALPDQATLERHLKSQSVNPTLALVFHTRSGYASGGRDALAALTAHKICVTGRGQAQLMPGTPLGPEDELAILQLLRPAASSGFRIFPENLLYSDGGTVMWWTPSYKGPMAMLDVEGNIIQRNVVWPNMVMMALGRRLFVAAIRENTRPDEATDLFFIPTGNVWINTEVCTGSAQLPTTEGIDSIAAWTAVFRDSAFTHDNNHGKSIAKKKGRRRSTDPMDFWREARHTSFPVDALVPTGFKLRDWLDYVSAVERR